MWWPLDEAWYKGTVKQWDGKQGKHQSEAGRVGRGMRKVLACCQHGPRLRLYDAAVCDPVREYVAQITTHTSI